MTAPPGWPPPGSRRSRWTYGLCNVIGAAVVVVLALVFVLDGRPPYEPRTAAASCDRGELVVAGGDDVSLGNQRRALISEWNDVARGERPPAVLVEVSGSTDLQRSQLKAVLDARGCAYDVLIMDNTWTAEFARRGHLRRLAEIRKAPVRTADFIPVALRSGGHGGEQYALPFNLDVGLLYRDAQTSRPDTWRRLLAEGYLAQLDDYEGLTVNALEVVWNLAGEDILSGPGTPDRDALASRAYPALQEMAAQVRRLEVMRDSRQLREAGSIARFAEDASAPGGLAPLMRNWPYAYRVLAAEPRMRLPGGPRFEVSPLPGRSVLGGQNLAVSAHSPRPRAALELIEFLTLPANQQRLFSCGGFVPARYDAFGLRDRRLDPGLVDMPTCPALLGEKVRPGDNDLPDKQQLDELARAVVAALGQARPRPETEHYVRFSTVFRECAAKIINGGAVTPDDFASAVLTALDGEAAAC